MFSILIDQPYRPFTHRVGQRILLPPRDWVEVSPQKLVFSSGKVVELPVTGRVDDFVAQLDLVKGVIEVSFYAAQQYWRFTIRADRIRFERMPEGFPKEIALGAFAKPDHFELLSCGIYKSQDWELICKRRDWNELLPLWGLAAQWKGDGGELCDPSDLLVSDVPSWETVRSLFLKFDGKLHLSIPKETPAGRIVGARFGTLVVDFEWTQWRPRRLILSHEVEVVSEAKQQRVVRGKKIYIDRFTF